MSEPIFIHKHVGAYLANSKAQLILSTAAQIRIRVALFELEAVPAVLVVATGGVGGAAAATAAVFVVISVAVLWPGEAEVETCNLQTSI